jgi:arginine metabolism regulation protein II
LIAAMSGQGDLFDFASFEHGSGTPADGRVEELFDLDSVPERLDIAASPGMSFWQDDSLANVGSPLPQIASPPMPITTPTLFSSDAIHLLSHYTNTVVSLLTPFRHTKTPWHILLIPHVKSCLAAIALNEQLDHASLCVFHGTLAMSALSLHGLSSEGPWGERSELHRHQAQQHAKLTIKAAYDIPKKAKYKTILMALITMIQVCVFSAKDPGSYFVEAEKFIRLKGLKRRKSRKVRLLHHCYVFERMFYESTSVTAADPDEQIALSRTVASSGIVVYGQDSPGFRLPDLSNLDASLQRVKDQAEGENDLHLAYPGDFPATMYPEVVAVPEIYMVLLSVIVRLGKAKDTNGVLPSDFLTQAKNLERAILRSSPATRDCRGGISSNAANENVLRDMRLAMHEALLLYFYRRIYDVDASLLQGRARLICECLLRCEAADSQSLYGSTGFRWPAFIAACETEELDVQQSFTLLFRRLAQRSGLSMFTSTLQDIQQVWSEKQKCHTVSVSWLDIMKRRPNPLTWANLTA